MASAWAKDAHGKRAPTAREAWIRVLLPEARRASERARSAVPKGARLPPALVGSASDQAGGVEPLAAQGRSRAGSSTPATALTRAERLADACPAAALEAEGLGCRHGNVELGADLDVCGWLPAVTHRRWSIDWQDALQLEASCESSHS